MFEIVKLNTIQFNEQEISKNVPARIEKKSKGVWDKSTFMYDVFYEEDHIKAVGPRMYSFETLINSGDISFDVDGKRIVPEMDTTSRDSILTFPATEHGKDLTVNVNSVAKYTGIVGKSYVDDLKDANVLVTINKNNELIWIKDWAVHYVKNHNVDTIVLFDNGSDKYSMTEVLNTLSQVEGLKNAFVISSPFMYGIPGATNWYENAMRNIAHYRFAAKANLVLIMDIDELLVSNTGNSLIDEMHKDNEGYVRFPSWFVENILSTNPSSSKNGLLDKITQKFGTAPSVTFKDFTVISRQHIEFLESFLLLGEEEQAEQVRNASPKFAYSPKFLKSPKYMCVHAAFFEDEETSELYYNTKKVSEDFVILHYRGISSSSSFWHKNDGGLHDEQKFNSKNHTEMPPKYLKQLERSWGEFDNLRFGLKEVNSGIMKIDDPDNYIQEITLKKSGNDKLIPVLFTRQGNEVIISTDQFQHLSFGAYFAQYSNGSQTYKALPAMLGTSKKIQERYIDDQLLVSYYATKGGNLGIRAVKLDAYSDVEVNNKFIETLRQHHVFLQQNDRYNKISGKYTVHPNLLIEPYTQLVNTNNILFSMGMASYAKSVELPAETTVGRYTSIAPGVKAMRGGRHPMNRFTTAQVTLSNPSEFGAIPTNAGFIKENKLETAYYKEKYDPIKIGNDVWIGQDVIIKRGVSIGDGAVIAQGAIVTKDVPPYALVAGVPGVVKRYRFDQDVIEELLKLKWWEYAYWDFEGIKAEDDIRVFIAKMKDLIETNKIQKFTPDALTFDDLK